MIYLSLLQPSYAAPASFNAFQAAFKTDSCVALATPKTDSDGFSAVQDLIVDAEVKSPEKMKCAVARLMPYNSWGLKENFPLLSKTDLCVAPATSKTDSDASSAVQDLIVELLETK